MNKLLIVACLIMIQTVLNAQYSKAHDAGYKLLGSMTFRYDNNHDVFDFQGKDLRLKSFYVIVKESNVSFTKVIIYYTDGTKKDITLDYNLFPEVYSKIIELKATDKVIQKFDFFHGTKVNFKKKPIVELWGK